MSLAPMHPRDDVGALDRLQSQYEAVETALRRERMHHAWLLCGPRGVGKSRFGYRLARRLLSGPGARIDDPLSSADPAFRLIAARSHPDFLALHRQSEDLKSRRVIPVDEVRRLPEFFAKAPSQGAYRVALIDAVDDLNANGANAVLKTLEEPPPRGVLILVSHAPGRLLDTIRSRCRRLNFPSWPESELAAWLDAKGEPATPASLAAGSPGRALARGGGASDAADATARSLLDGLPAIDVAVMQSIVDGFRGEEGAERFTTICERLADHIHADLSASALAGRKAERWVRVWERLQQTPGEVEALNLNPGDAFWSLVGELRTAASSGANA